MTDHYLDLARGVYHRGTGEPACDREVDDQRQFIRVDEDDVKKGWYPKCLGCFSPSAGDSLSDFHDPT